MRGWIAGLAVVVVLIWGLVVVAGVGVLGFAAYRVTRTTGRDTAAHPPTPAPQPQPAPPPVDPQPEFRPPPARVPGELPANSNAVLARYPPARLKATASSQWGGGSWPAANAFDRVLTNAWYSSSSDSPRSGKFPWVMVTLPEDVTVRRVTVLGTRDASYQLGYRALAGRIELLDAGGRVLATAEPDPVGAKRDFDFIPLRPVGGVRAVRFTATAAEGSSVAVTEVQVE
jgi:hypothetical protein